jgi:hypothetical protein
MKRKTYTQRLEEELPTPKYTQKEKVYVIEDDVVCGAEEGEDTVGADYDESNDSDAIETVALSADHYVDLQAKRAKREEDDLLSSHSHSHSHSHIHSHSHSHGNSHGHSHIHSQRRGHASESADYGGDGDISGELIRAIDAERERVAQFHSALESALTHNGGFTAIRSIRKSLEAKRKIANLKFSRSEGHWETRTRARSCSADKYSNSDSEDPEPEYAYRTEVTGKGSMAGVSAEELLKMCREEKKRIASNWDIFL